MRIGVDATCWQNTRGYGRHARALLAALVKQDTKNRYTFFMDSSNGVVGLPTSINLVSVSASAPTVLAASASGHRSARDMLRIALAMSRAQLDVLLFPTIYSYVPVISRAKKIVIIHDVIAEKYPSLTMPKRRSRLLWKTKVALGRWQADAIATVSDYSRKGLVDYFSVKPERIHIVGEASDPVFRVIDDKSLTPRLKSLGLAEDQRLIVYVGGFSPHKNLQALVDAFARLTMEDSFSDVRLVFVGEDKKEVFHSYVETIRTQIAQLNINSHVVFTGYLPDDELAVLLNAATVSVLPSLIEGFGLPAVEAAACGCPVIATRESPLPELLGKGGLYFDPTQLKELEESLRKLLTSEQLRKEMSKEARSAAARLTWENAAEQMLEVINRVTES